jgi:hypothetical protein
LFNKIFLQVYSVQVYLAAILEYLTAEIFSFNLFYSGWLVHYCIFNSCQLPSSLEFYLWLMTCEFFNLAQTLRSKISLLPDARLSERENYIHKIQN